MFLNSPEQLLWLILIPLFVWGILKYKPNYSIPYTSTEQLQKLKPNWKLKFIWVPLSLQILALVFLILVLADPVVSVNRKKEKIEGIAIEMLVDVSSSMDMNMDYRGQTTTRMEVAKKVLQQFVNGDGKQLYGRQNDLIGIITFARYADTICPLTFGHEALTSMAKELSINDQPNEDGTAYGDALALAAARLHQYEKLISHQNQSYTQQQEKIKSKIIILLTDGENNCGKHMPIAAAAMANAWGIRIYSISIGEESDIDIIEHEEGNIQISGGLSHAQLELKKMAESTGGIFRRANDYDSLQSVYEEIDQLEKSDVRIQEFQRSEPYGALFLAPALLCLIISVLLGSGPLRRTF